MVGSAGRDYGDWAFHWACLLGDRTILWAYHSRPLQQPVRAGILMERRSEWGTMPDMQKQDPNQALRRYRTAQFPAILPKVPTGNFD